MGRNKKTYSDDFKIKVVKEAIESGKTDSEVAAANEIAPSTLCDWKKAYLNGSMKTKEEKKLLKQIEQLQKEKQILLQALGRKELENELLKKKDKLMSESGHW